MNITALDTKRYLCVYHVYLNMYVCVYLCVITTLKLCGILKKLMVSLMSRLWLGASGGKAMSKRLTRLATMRYSSMRLWMSPGQARAPENHSTTVEVSL
jgi:hypothetical protein